MQGPEQHFERFRRSGDAAALAAVFDAVAPELLLVAAHVAPTGVEPEDLLQATFVDAIEHAARWDATRRLMPWLIGVLVQHARVERRRLARRVDEARLVEREVDDPAVVAETADIGQRVAAAVASMPVLYRQVLTLRLVHGLTPTQIAAALGCPIATVKTRLQRGMELLRGALPAGLATSVALLCGSGRGLAQVKAAVLAKVGGVVPVAIAGGAVAAGWFGGTIAMKKFAVAVVALVCLALAWSFSPWAGGGDPLVPRPLDGADAALGGVVAATVETATHPEAVGAAAPVTRAAVPSATGEAVLTFVWNHDGSPASGLRVTVRAVSSARDGFDGRADRRGRLQLEGLEPGDYTLFGFRLSAKLTVLAGQRVEQRFEVEAGQRCDGIVVDANGVGVADADVFVQYFPDRQDAAPRWLARSGADGTFRCATDYGGSFWARKAGRVAGAPVSNETEGPVMLRLELGGVGAVLRGRVLGADGRGIADAHVLTLAQGDPAVCPPPVEVSTDGEGAYVVDELGVGPQLLIVEAAGHAANATLIELRPGDDNRLDVQLGRGAILEGHVRDRAERPLRATVAVRPAWAGSEDRWAEALRPIYLRCEATARTADDGSYRLDCVPVGAVEVVVGAGREQLDESRSLTVAEGVTARCDFWLRSSGPIRGRLVDAVGAPLVGWAVLYEPIGGGRAARGVTGDDGAFAEAGLDAERYRVTAAPPDAAAGVPWATADDVGHDLEVLLRAVCRPEQGGRLVGRALTADGVPAQRLALGLTLAGARQGSVRDVSVGRDGAFATGLLPVCRLRVSARIDDEGGVDLGERDVVSGIDVELGEVRVPGRGMIELRLRGADGGLVAPDELRIFGAGGNRCEVFDEVQDGGYRSAPVPAGRYTLFASGAGFVRVLQQVEVAVGGTTAVEVPIVAACTVRFELVDGAPVPGARRLSLQVFDAAERSVGGAASLLLEPGQPCISRRGYAAGRYRFEVKDGGREVGSGTFEVGAAHAPEVVVSVTVAD